MESKVTTARVFIVEDHEIVRQMLREYLEEEPDLVVSGEAATAEEALKALAEAEAELVLVDVALPGMSGIELVHRLHARHPKLPMAMLSGHRENSYVNEALEAGASGYILKGQSDKLAAALRQVVQGEQYLSPVLQT